MKKQLILLALAIAAVCANAQDVIHQVKRGETLESIAGTYGVPAEEILKANPNMGGRFYAGMKIAIPNQNNESATPKAPTTVIYQTEVAEETQQPKTNRRRENRKKQSDKYYGTRQGGFALSFGAAPVINFIGNMFNGTTNQSFEGFKGLGSDLFNGATISGKYMLRDNWALTAGIGFNNSKEEKITYSDPENKEKETVRISQVQTNACLW